MPEMFHFANFSSILFQPFFRISPLFWKLALFLSFAHSKKGEKKPPSLESSLSEFFNLMMMLLCVLFLKYQSRWIEYEVRSLSDRRFKRAAKNPSFSESSSWFSERFFFAACLSRNSFKTCKLRLICSKNHVATDLSLSEADKEGQ